MWWMFSIVFCKRLPEGNEVMIYIFGAWKKHLEIDGH